MVQDLIPYIEANYRTLKDADHRAIGGLSMGGGQTIQLGFSHPELFHYIIVMSAGSGNADTAYPNFVGNAATTNKTANGLSTRIIRQTARVQSRRASP